MGRGHDLRDPRRRHQRRVRSAPAAAGKDPVRAGAARGSRRIRRLRLCQVHGQARRVPRDLGTRRNPPLERHLRRQARQSASARDHRGAASRPDRDLHPAGRRARQALHGCDGLFGSSHGSGARRGRRRASMPNGALLPPADARDDPGRFPVAAGEGPVGAQRRRPRLEHHGAGRPPAQSRHAPAGGRHPQPGRKAVHPRRPRLDRRDSGAARSRRAAAGADRQAVAGQAGGARRKPLHDRRRRTARHQAVARRRWKAATPC